MTCRPSVDLVIRSGRVGTSLSRNEQRDQRFGQLTNSFHSSGPYQILRTVAVRKIAPLVHRGQPQSAAMASTSNVLRTISASVRSPRNLPFFTHGDRPSFGFPTGRVCHSSFGKATGRFRGKHVPVFSRSLIGHHSTRRVLRLWDYAGCILRRR